MSSFKNLRIVDNFYQTSAFYPMPTVCITTVNPDGSLNVMNSGRNETGHFKQASGRAFPVKDGILEVSFVWPYWWFGAPYHILYVDKDYQAALVSGDDEDYLWLLTRERNPKPEIIKKLKQEAERRGFDTSKLRFTRQ